MKKYFCTLIVVVLLSFVFQACVVQQLEVNPGFGKRAALETATPKAPAPKLAEGPEAPKPLLAKPVTKSTAVKAEKPEWRIGYWWKYAWKRPGKKGTYTRRVVREEIFDGHPSYVLKSGKNEYFFTKDILGNIAKMSKGKLVYKRDAPRQNFAWPLEVGRQWKNSYNKEYITEERSQTHDYRMVVAKLEEVRVAAGTFKCFKTEVYISYTGDLFAEYWYSPEVKHIVKYTLYTRDGPREGELISFNAD